MTRHGPVFAVIRDDMLASGLPPALVDESLDLARHAIDQACRQLETICKRGSSGLVRENAFSIAVAVGSAHLRRLTEELADEARADPDHYQVGAFAVVHPGVEL